MTLGFTLADSRPQTVPNSDFLTSLSVRPIDEKIELKGLVVNFGPRSGEHLAQRQKRRASADKSPRGFCIGGWQKDLIHAAVCPLLLWAPMALQYAVLMVSWLFDTFSSIMGDQNDYCGMHSCL